MIQIITFISVLFLSCCFRTADGAVPAVYSYELKSEHLIETQKGTLINIDQSKFFSFLQIWEFNILLLFLLLLPLWFWYHFELKKKKIEQKLRNKISSDLHDELGGLLTAISMQAELLQVHKKEMAKKMYLTKIEKLSKSAIKKMGEIIWTVDAKSDNWGDLILKMREFSNKLFDFGKTKFYFSVEGDLPKKLSQKEKHSVYLIYKEALNNICKHSCASRASGKLVFLKNKIQLKIKDDGKGLKIAKQRSSQGLKNMKMRAKSIKAYLSIMSTEKGTEVLMEMRTRRKIFFWSPKSKEAI